MTPGARGLLFVVALLGVVDLALFADVLSPWGTTLPSAGDVEIHGRLLEFAAAHLRHGQLPLWNPHVFSGTPALGNPNAMMLYPLSLLDLALPLPLAISLATVLHTLLAGTFTYLWTVRRGLHPAGCVLAAAMVSFGGPFFARIHAGHLSALAAMAWSPLVLLSVDELLRRPSVLWVAVGAVAVAMQVLGGHPQYVFYSLLAAGASVLLRLAGTPRPWRVLAAFAAMVVWGTSLAAVQLVPTLDALAETVRGGSLAFASASTFSMTWSGFIMLLVPRFFGHGALNDYWGDWLYWEVVPFVGIVGLAAAVYGAVRGNRRTRAFAGLLAVTFLVLSLGSNTPVLGLLYAWVPPFDRLRSSARALFQFGLFAAMLAAVGIDALARDRRRAPTLVAALGGTALALALFAGWIWMTVSGARVTTREEIAAVLRLPLEQRELRIREVAAGDDRWAERLRRAGVARDLAVQSDPVARARATDVYWPPYVEAMSVDRWQDLRAWLVPTKGYAYPLEEWADPAVGRRQAWEAVGRCLLAAAICAATAILVHRASGTTNAALGLVVLGIAELIGFAGSIRATFDLRPFRPASLAAFFRERPGDYRVYHATLRNGTMSVGGLDIWGYDPFVSARYAEYIAATQGEQAGAGDHLTPIQRAHRSYGMLRLQYILAQADDGERVNVLAGPTELPSPLPRVALMRHYQVHDGGAAVLAALDSLAWDPARTVLLESEPHPTPTMGGTGTVAVRDESTDHLTIDAELSDPAILLVSDAYSRGWRVRALDHSDQSEYEVLPANRVLRAVPLAAGRHHIRMEYVPSCYRLGAALSLGALAMLLVVGGRAALTRRAA